MKYVVDSSVAFKWVVPEPFSDKALQLRADYENAVHDLVAPDIFPIEIGHALTRAERQKRIPVGAAVPLLTDILRTLPNLHISLAFLLRACDISSTARVGIYDCLYVALSEREQCQFVKADDKLVKTLQPKFPQIIHLSAMP
jgi:predicted nucleic acid-binding protein